MRKRGMMISSRTGEPGVTAGRLAAALGLSTVFALLGWLLLRQSAAESALISAALGLAAVSIYFISQRNRSRTQAADLKRVTEALRESEERFRDFATV
jgi:hypothetical protein